MVFTSPLHKTIFSTTIVISSLHQQFTFVHLVNIHLPRSPRLFPDRSQPQFYNFSSAGRFDNLAWYSVVGGPSTIFQRTSWHKQRLHREIHLCETLCSLCLCGKILLLSKRKKPRLWVVVFCSWKWRLCYIILTMGLLSIIFFSCPFFAFPRTELHANNKIQTSGHHILIQPWMNRTTTSILSCFTDCLDQDIIFFKVDSWIAWAFACQSSQILLLMRGFIERVFIVIKPIISASQRYRWASLFFAVRIV